MYVAEDERIISTEILWFSLSLSLVLLYGVLRRYLPGAVVLRDLPWQNDVQDSDFGWIRGLVLSIKRTLSLSESALIAQCGLDGFFTLRLIRFCTWTLLVICAYNLLVQAPFNYSQPPTRSNCEQYCELTGRNSDEKDVYHASCICGFIDKCSLANVADQSTAQWMSVLSMYAISAWVLYQLEREYCEIVRIRHDHWLNRPCQLHTVFVHNIPTSLSSEKSLWQYFDRLFPGKVHKVTIASAMSSLTALGRKRMHIILRLERSIAIKNRRCSAQVNKEQQRPRHWTLTCGGMHRVDSIDHYREELQLVTREFKRVKQQEMANMEPCQYAFVTFNEVTSAVIASQTLLHQDMEIAMALHPNDIRWGTFQGTSFSALSRKTMSRLIFVLIILFWGGITSFIGAATSTAALSQEFQWLKDFLHEHPTFVSYIDRVSALVYVTLISLVYPIITFIVSLEVQMGQSQVQQTTFARYFLFLVVQVFVFYSIAGTVFKSAVEIAKQPSTIFSTLSANIPRNASFFITFLAVKCFWLFFDMVRGYDFIFHMLRRLFYGVTITKRELRFLACGLCWDFHFPGHYDLAGAQANFMLVYFIAISYACIQPVLSLTALIYFLCANVCFSTILTTSTKQMFDGGGVFWTHAYWCIIASVVTSQMTLIGSLLTKHGFTEAVVVFALLVATFLVATQVHDRHHRAVTNVPMQVAREMDATKSSDNSHYGTFGNSSRSKEVLEVTPDLVFTYNVVNRAYEPVGDYCDSEDLSFTKVFDYEHPALLEEEDLREEATEQYTANSDDDDDEQMRDGSRVHHLDWSSFSPKTKSKLYGFGSMKL